MICFKIQTTWQQLTSSFEMGVLQKVKFSDFGLKVD